MLIAMLLACGDPILNCDQPAEIADCCETDDECRAFYGGDFAFCYFPGRNTGICGECQKNSDCDGANEICVEDIDIGALCCDPEIYYCE